MIEYMALEVQLWSVNYMFVARIYKNNANDKAKSVYIYQVLKSIKRFISNSRQQNITFQQFYESHCDC